MPARYCHTAEPSAPYPPIGGTRDKPYTHEDIFKKNAMQAFASDFDLTGWEARRWILPGTSLDEWFESDSYQTKKLKELHDALEKAMFGSADMIRTVFETAATHNRNEPHGLRFEDKSRFERERYWKQAFTDQVFRSILSPLGDAVDTAKFLEQDSVWRKQYTAMFVAAAEAMCIHASCPGQDGKGYLVMSEVYRAVRKKVNSDFKDCPRFDSMYVKEKKVITGQKRKLEDCINMGLFDDVPGALKRVGLKKALHEVYPDV
ncbi:hypothetical protein SLS60_000105 [Paraconiothyrium brasiliense]|uniref:Uncharacterized protein n=1 Tax=Paraconiothyrium brasiliense TaxID=300254 RepID=A0ABR3S5W3_9PLEO